MLRNWIAAHIFYSGDPDLVITEYLSPFIAAHLHLFNEQAPYFFIRYPEGGDHIRLRINTIYPDDVKVMLSLALPDMPVQYVSYDPEVERYGNEESLPWAEEHFSVSSRVIMEWHCDRVLKPASAQIEAMRLHLLLLLSTGWKRDGALMLCEYFINDWLRIFHPGVDKEKWLNAFESALVPQKEMLFTATLSFWNDVMVGKIVPYYFSRNREIMLRFNSAGLSLEQLTVIITSMMHMTHNRLGIDNREEAYIMYCTHACLSYIFNQS